MNNLTQYLKKIPIVYHIGHMDKNLKVKNSYEGSGLSVSTKPESWKIILRIADRPIHTIQVNEPFLDLRKIKKNQYFFQQVISYSLQCNLITLNTKEKTGFSGTTLMETLFFQDYIRQSDIIDFCFIYFFIQELKIYNFFWNYPNKPLKLQAPVGVLYEKGCFD